MSKSEKLVYDILTIIFVLSVVIGIYLSYSTNIAAPDSPEALNSSLYKLNIPYLIAGVSILIYSIAIIVLGIRRGEKTSQKIIVVIGSLIIPGLLPLFYYFNSLRKLIPS